MVKQKGRYVWAPSMLVDELTKIKQMRPGLTNADATRILAFNSSLVRNNTNFEGNILDKITMPKIKKNKKAKKQYNIMDLRF